MFKNVDWVWSSTNFTTDNSNLELQMASSGYYHCKTGCEKSMDNLPEMQNQLNNAPASFHGNLIRFKKEGTYHYMSTRNNAFSNRAQKGDITVINQNWNINTRINYFMILYNSYWNVHGQTLKPKESMKTRVIKTNVYQGFVEIHFTSRISKKSVTVF